MKTLLHITFAKIKRNYKKSVLQSVAVFISIFVISFFTSFITSLEEYTAANPTFGIEASGAESALTITSLERFFESVINAISLMAGAVAFLSVISIYIYSRMRTEENKRFYAILSSIGATRVQTKIISVTETLILYAAPIVLGSFLGLIPSGIFTSAVVSIFAADYSPSSVALAIPFGLSLLGIILVLIFTYVPGISRKGSVIESVRAHNEREAGERHNYRKSYTFRHMPIEQRIAYKSVEYYKSSYRRITVMFISCVLYPVLAILFFSMISDVRVVDYTPTSGINAMRLFEIFIWNIAGFAALAFIVLSAFAILETVYMIQAHNRVRRETLKIYKSVGMTDGSIKKVLKYEYRTVFMKAAIYLVFILVIAFPIVISLGQKI